MAPSRETVRCRKRASVPPPGPRGRRAIACVAGSSRSSSSRAAVLAWRLWDGASRRRHGPVILVVIDTLRADRLPVYGYAAGRAPASTAFAREAVVFDRAYAHAPQTLPVPRVDVHRSPAVRAQGPRQPGVHACAMGTPTLAVDVPGARDTRPAGSSPRTCCAPRPASGRASTSTTRRFRRWPPIGRPAQVQRPGPQTLAAADAWLTLADVGPLLPLPSPLRAAQAVSARPTASRISRAYDGEVAFADEIVGTLFDEPEDARLVRRRDDRRARRITARASAITSRRSTGSSSTTRSSACRG